MCKTSCCYKKRKNPPIPVRRKIVLPPLGTEVIVNITENTTFEIPPGARNITVTLWGGGAGAGGGSIFSNGVGSGAGGGASGYVLRARVRRPQTMEIIIAEGGLGGIGQTAISESIDGEDGGSTAVNFPASGKTLTAYGGDGGHRSMVIDAITFSYLDEKGFGGTNSTHRGLLKGADGGNGEGDGILATNGGDFHGFTGGVVDGPSIGSGGGGAAGWNGNGGDPGNSFSLNGMSPAPNSGAGGGAGGRASNINPNQGGNGAAGGSGGVQIRYFI